MKTNRRGFFSAITGLAAGVWAAFQPGKKIALGKVRSWVIDTTDGELPAKLNRYGESPLQKAIGRDNLERDLVTANCGDWIVITNVEYHCKETNDPPQD